MTEATLTVRRLRGRGFIIVSSRAREARLAAALESEFGEAPRPGRAVERSNVRALWLAPGAWVIKGEALQAREAAARIAAQAGATATDVSAARPTWLIEGALWRDLLSMGCPLDAFAENFGPANATSTRFADFTVVLDVVTQDRIEVHVARSHGDDFERFVTRAVQRILADQDAQRTASR